jgi:hypothetical protein
MHEGRVDEFQCPEIEEKGDEKLALLPQNRRRQERSPAISDSGRCGSRRAATDLNFAVAFPVCPMRP